MFGTGKHTESGETFAAALLGKTAHARQLHLFGSSGVLRRFFADARNTWSAPAAIRISRRGQRDDNFRHIYLRGADVRRGTPFGWLLYRLHRRGWVFQSPIGAGPCTTEPV